MTKAQVIRWLKSRQTEVADELETRHKKERKDYRHRFVCERITALERGLLAESAASLLADYDSLMQALLTEGPSRSWSQRTGDIRAIAETDLVHHFVERLDFDYYPPYTALESAQLEARQAADLQWKQLIAHAQTLRYRDLLAFLEGLDLTPPPDEPVAAPALPMVAFDREVLMGVK